MILHANDKGLADYYYFAFEMFGLNINALVLFYCLLLCASAVMFFLTFRSSPFCMFLLGLFLIGHYYMLGYATTPVLQAVHNSRFFPVMAMLPTMHLLLLVLRSEPPTVGRIAAAIGQTGLLYFLIFCRSSALWQAGAVIASPILVLRLGDYAGFWRVLRWPRQAGPALAALAARTWPAMVAAAGFVAFVSYSQLAVDRTAYRTEPSAHAVWDAILAGTLAANPELYRLYGNNDPPYGDQIVPDAIMDDLRERHDRGPDIAFVVDGVIYIDPWRDMIVYERLARHVFFKVLAAHPLLVLKSFLYGKPHDQIMLLEDVPRITWELDHVRYDYLMGYGTAYILAVILAILTVIAGEVRWQPSCVPRALVAIAFLAIFSSTTTLVTPSLLIPDTLLFYVMLSLFVLAYLPVTAMWTLWSIARKKQSGVFLQT